MRQGNGYQVACASTASAAVEAPQGSNGAGEYPIGNVELML